MNDGMESYNGHLSCKSHTARTDKDLYRICPSKLSKRELEDLYFALLEQNVQLKKTINDQRDQIKLLNTKVQRMTTQKSVVGFHNRDCCAGTKAIINEQKEAIADLKKANERLSERLRLLNMRLCSAKQFLRRGSSQAASHCSKCLVSSASNKNSSMSALNTKGSDAKLVISCSPCQTEQDNTKIQMTEIAAPTQLTEVAVPTLLAEIAVPTQLTEIAVPTLLTDNAVPTQLTDIAAPTQLTDNAVPTQLVEIVIPTQSAEVTSSRIELPVREAQCERDECRAEIDELKVKIVALEEEVCNVRHSHSERMRSLEAAQAQYGSRSARLQSMADYRDSRQQTDELTSHLQQQQARMRELLATDRTDRAAPCPTKDTLSLNDARESVSPEPGFSDWENVPRIIVPNNSGISIFVEEKRHKSSDDSGFNVFKTPDLGINKERTLQERDGLIENQITNLQSKLVYRKANAEVGRQAEPSSVGLRVESDLSHDIFSTSRIKTLKEFDKIPSTSRAPDVLVSMDQINDEVSLSGKPQEYINVFKYNIPKPLSLDMPKIIETKDTETDIHFFENEATNKNFESSSNIKTSKENIKTNSDNVNQIKQELVDGGKNTIIDSLDKSNQIIQEIIDERKTNNSFKKNRRSSLKPPYEGKQNRDLAVRYGDTQMHMSSAKSETIPKNVSQGTDIHKVYIEPDEDHESDPSVQYKINERMSMRHIRYMKDVETDPYMASEQKSSGIDSADDGTRRDGIHSVTNDVGIQCLRDIKPDRSCEAEQMVSYVSKDVVKEATTNVDPYNPVICAGLSRVCECPSRSAASPLSLRTCSGIPVPAASIACGERYRTCACGHDPPPPSLPRHSSLEPHYSQSETLHSPTEARHSSLGNYHSSPEYLNSVATSEHRKSLPEARQSLTKSRPTSLNRTECDASSLADLTDTHDASPLDYISPGEEKATSTLCESYVTTDGGSLSEGELPAVGSKRLSATLDNMTKPVWSSRPDKMEEALRAISDELTLCRELLQGKGEQVSRRSSESPSSGQGAPPFALRRASGVCRMRDSYTPKCIFTLHVGTVVLADQAAAAARGRWLQASWRLYRQAASSTRALRGRVFNYDCTTHYDLKITEHFLYYLKHEEMPIIISEVDKQDEEFATCALPLRDALLHPNRRVDMSLALVPCGGGEEAGVLDVWCSLRVDAASLPAINTAIVRPSSLKSQHQQPSSMLEQILDDDQSADYRFSKDLHLRRNKGASDDNQSCYSEILDKVPELRSSVNEVIKNEVPANIRSVNDFKQAVAKKSNDATSIYEMLKNKNWNRRKIGSTIITEGTLGSQKTQEGGRQKSVTICNQASSSSIDRGNVSNETNEMAVLSQSYISAEETVQSLDITILWLALNEGCRAMSDPSVKKLYVAYSFLGRSGADLETPISLPKPKHYMDKCHFLYKKTFKVNECEMLSLGRLASCMPAAGDPDPSRAVVFSIVSEPADDPLGLYSCEDIGYAYLYLGEVLYRSAGNTHTAVLEVKDERRSICGALAVRIDGLALLRRCRDLAGTPI